jgi:pSer/pThr/pTyr-binding forkhead associated (FHA) protein
MAVKVVVRTSDHKGQDATYELDQSLITFGRSKSCHISLPHPDVSRRHFIVRYDDGRYILVDEGSRLGTSIDGTKVAKQTINPLRNEHEIMVPGFFIKILCDGQEPKLERTKAIARKLLDDLLQPGASHKPLIPSLISQDYRYKFYFTEDKSSYILGSLPYVDFVIEEDNVGKKHLSFARDINGISLMPLPDHEVFLNDVKVLEPQILTDRAKVQIAGIGFTFYEGMMEHDQPATSTPIEHSTNISASISHLDDEKACSLKEKKDPTRILRIIDQIFIWLFLLTIGGVSFLILLYP